MNSRLVILSSILSTALACSPGCVSSQHQKAPANTPAAFALNLPGTPASPLQARVDTVIVFDGPGSWKRRAFWDEYVLSFANVGNAPVKLLYARLIDADGVPMTPGRDWESLERQSADWCKRNATVENVALGAGMTVLGATAGTSLIALTLALAGGFVPLLGIAAGATLVSVGTAYLVDQPNQDSRREIAAEFDRRRLDFPLTLRPGEDNRASLFFRITPSPKELLLTFEADGRAQTVTIELAPLSQLHRKPSPNGN